MKPAGDLEFTYINFLYAIRYTLQASTVEYVAKKAGKRRIDLGHVNIYFDTE